MTRIKFYSLKRKKEVYVDANKITIKTLKNGRKVAEAIDPETGAKMFKFLSKEDLKLFGKSEDNDDNELPDSGDTTLLKK
ncbi:MAG TPA: hypothetical protein VMW28_09570 [Pelolinea sp.]|nr:hypothetical protein [Pelolinea sp.]